MLFSIEQAHWFYEDKCRERYTPSLRSFTLRDFTNLLFQRCVALKPYAARVNDIYNEFTSYKFKVPVTGAIILDQSMTRCVLVKGWRSSASWGFPKGKKGLNETDAEAAVREVWEETGFDVSSLVDASEYLEVVAGNQQQRSRLFVVASVDSRTAKFQPQTVKEISEIAWHLICDLASAQSDGALPVSRAVSGAKLFMVQPFVRPLLEWIDRHHTADTRQLAVHMMPQNVPGSIISVWKTSSVLPSSPQTAIHSSSTHLPTPHLQTTHAQITHPRPTLVPTLPSAATAVAAAAASSTASTGTAHSTVPTTTALPHIPSASPSSLHHPVSSRHGAARKQLFPADSSPLSTSAASSSLLPGGSRAGILRLPPGTLPRQSLLQQQQQQQQQQPQSLVTPAAVEAAAAPSAATVTTLLPPCTEWVNFSFDRGAILRAMQQAT
ncbi:hypothetical protein CLOP_g25036 [Closterium sp. NIES-67]|nr:hypothetical protein CLOP_g25036 [Closterium sp. NIES-67]